MLEVALWTDLDAIKVADQFEEFYKRARINYELNVPID
jgi:hypothetical protein